jgi:hypothetical protein
VFPLCARGNWIRWAILRDSKNVRAKNSLPGGEDIGEGERQNILSIPNEVLVADPSQGILPRRTSPSSRKRKAALPPNFKPGSKKSQSLLTSAAT